MLRKIFLLVSLLFFASSASAMSFYKFMYKVEEGESFSLILKKFVKENSIINASTPLVKKTRKYNPKIKDWSKIPTDTVIELYISDDFMDLEKFNAYEESTLEKIANENENKKNPSYPTGLKGSIFYMSSLGTFNQKADNVAEINFKQNSPASLGSAFTYYPKDKLYSVSFSAYISYLLASANNLTTETISIPPEIGANVYGEYRWQKNNVTLYAGPDFESFSAFNLRGLQNDRKIYVDGIGATYLTLGMAKSFSIFNKQFFSKISLSKSLITSYSNNAPVSQTDASDHVDLGKYSGYRFLFYLNYKFTDKLYLHSLLKYHTMTGPSELTTLRIGLGFGYILF